MGDMEDKRMDPPKNLVLRQSVKIPAGTTFGWDEDQIDYFVKTGYLYEREKDAVVLELKMNNEDYTLVQSELEAVVSCLSENELSNVRDNSIQCRGELLARIYLSRFPFED
jgi:hypothetical protein